LKFIFLEIIGFYAVKRDGCMIIAQCFQVFLFPGWLRLSRLALHQAASFVRALWV